MQEHGPMPTEEVERYSRVVLAKIHSTIEAKRPANLVISDGERTGELDYLLSRQIWEYPQRLFSLLPTQDRSVLSPNPSYAETCSFWGRYFYLNHLGKQLGVGGNQFDLHRVEARNLDSVHLYHTTNIPLVFYHNLGCWVPVEGPGWSGEFITIGLTEEELKSISLQAGARFERDIFRDYPDQQIDRENENAERKKSRTWNPLRWIPFRRR